MGYLRSTSPAAGLFLLLAMFFGFMIGSGVLLEVLFPLLSGGYNSSQFTDPNIAKQASFVQALKIVQFLYSVLAFMVPAVLFAWMVHPRPTEYLGLRKAPKFTQLLLAIAIMLSLLPLVGVTADWNSHWDLVPALRELEEMAEQQTRVMLVMPDVGSMLVMVLLIGLVPAMAEEFFFRGVMQRLFTQITKDGWVAIFITSIFFSTLHFQFSGFLPRIVLSMGLGALYYLTGNLWLSVAGHFLNNGLQVVLAYLFQAKIISYDVMSEEATPLYYGIVSLVVAGFLIVVLSRRAKAAGQTFELAPLEDEIKKDDEDSIFKDY